MHNIMILRLMGVGRARDVAGGGCGEHHLTRDHVLIRMVLFFSSSDNWSWDGRRLYFDIGCEVLYI